MWALSLRGTRTATVKCRNAARLDIAVACRRGAASDCTRAAVTAAGAAGRQAAAPPGASLPGMCEGMQELCDAYYAATAFKARRGALAC